MLLVAKPSRHRHKAGGELEMTKVLPYVEHVELCQSQLAVSTKRPLRSAERVKGSGARIHCSLPGTRTFRGRENPLTSLDWRPMLEFSPVSMASRRRISNLFCGKAHGKLVDALAGSDKLDGRDWISTVGGAERVARPKMTGD
jgi:hypothetical protein